MISPGSAFKFDGLKNVLSSVKPTIESSKLKRVEKLKRNYRVTKDVLNFANVSSMLVDYHLVLLCSLSIDIRLQGCAKFGKGEI